MKNRKMKAAPSIFLLFLTTSAYAQSGIKWIYMGHYLDPSSIRLNPGICTSAGGQSQGNGVSVTTYAIAMTSAFGAGVTLSEAVGLVLLEPDLTLATMLQTCARHYRQGNKNEETSSWLFPVKGNRVEEKIMDVDRMRAEIEKTLE
ncbi:hypothetical protein PVAG01_03082 [Phlyctema vagabunda]|uniref:Uncharacterized protein n=1 Tax=Phlyctema vagabunda TaxID=108571 RepID=A0ABR4PTU0_9HELO